MSRFPSHPERRPAVITGASAGIGAATAQALAAAGFPVALGARRLERCEKIAARIREAGGEAVAHRLDVTSADSVDAFASAVATDLGPVEVVVSNAGGMAPMPILQADSADVGHELDVNILGAHRVLRAFVPGMVQRARGDFVVVSSDVVAHPRPRLPGYVSAKWGLEGLATVARMELEGTGVRVSIVRPGPTGTDIANDWPADQITDLLDAWQAFGLTRHGGFCQDVDVARAVVGVVGMPRGSSLTLVEVQPEAPVARRTEGNDA